ncbi:MAG: aspartate carbamoyltransferase catalytic subunit [Planctomycetota bacterium]|nr:aspartate carbamoyltransferase catalytic subunit [Planctomycetota bacterium]
MEEQEERLVWGRKHLLGLEELSRDELEVVFRTAESFKEVSTRSIKKVPALRGKVVVNLFFEPSTRTKTSFALAATRLSADVVDFAIETSSAVKGETLSDTARNIEAMGVDIVVVRHSAAGAAVRLAQTIEASVVNAGDGAHEHPTQGLLDIFTILQHKGSIEGLKVAIVGDVAHSRVARSNIWGLKKLGASVVVVGPSTLIPSSITELGVEVSYDLDAVLPQCDVVNLLRVQKERHLVGYFPSTREYARLFGMNSSRLKQAKPDVLIMHPGPVNRGVEITPEVVDGDRSVVLEQVSNGLAIRMAVLFLVSGKGNE